MAIAQDELTHCEDPLSEFRRWASHSKLLSPKTTDDRLVILRRALLAERFWFPAGLQNATPKEIKRYVDSTLNTAASRNALRLALIAFFDGAIEFERREDNPALLLPIWKTRDCAPKPLEPQEASALLTAARQSSPRDGALISGYLHGGLRLTELAERPWPDLRGRRLHFVGKGNRPQIRYMNAAAMGDLEILRRSRDRRFRLMFPSNADPRQPLTRRVVYKIVNRLGDSVGIDGCHPHQLRHTFAQALYEATGDIHLVQRALGHVSIQSTLKYARHSQRGLEGTLDNLAY